MREIGDRRGEGAALGNLGNALYQLGEKEKGIKMMKEALRIFEEIESPNAEGARRRLMEWGEGDWGLRIGDWGLSMTPQKIGAGGTRRGTKARNGIYN